LVGFAVATIDFKNEFPEIGDALTATIYGLTVFLAFGVPVIGWLISLVSMKVYPLDKKKMAEIQMSIAEVKEKAEKDRRVASSLKLAEESKDWLAHFQL